MDRPGETGPADYTGSAFTKTPSARSPQLLAAIPGRLAMLQCRLQSPAGVAAQQRPITILNLEVSGPSVSGRKSLLFVIPHPMSNSGNAEACGASPAPISREGTPPIATWAGFPHSYRSALATSLM